MDAIQDGHVASPLALSLAATEHTSSSAYSTACWKSVDSKNLLDVAIRCQTVRSLQIQIVCGADVKHVKSDSSETLLHCAVKHVHDKDVLFAILDVLEKAGTPSAKNMV